MKYVIDKYGHSLSDIVNNSKWSNIHIIGALGKKEGKYLKVIITTFFKHLMKRVNLQIQEPQPISVRRNTETPKHTYTKTHYNEITENQ